MRSKAIIIGSGISGLTAATILARKGFDVTILERNKAIGGALQRFKRRNIDFDVGFHYTGGLGEGQILTRLWRYLGILDSITINSFPHNASDCVSFYNSKLQAKAYFSYPRIEEELSILFPQERKGIKAFFSLMQTLGQSMPCYSFRGELDAFLQSLAFPEKKTLGDYLRANIHSPELQSILSLPVFLHGVEPDRMGLTMHASVAHSVYSGMYSIDQGGRSVVDAFSAKLADYGAAVHCDQEVEKIIVENGQTTGVTTKHTNFYAPLVIYTGHPSFLSTITPPGIYSKAYCNRLNQLHNTDSMFIIFGTLNKDTVENKYLWNNYYAINPDLNILSPKEHPIHSNFFLSSCGGRDNDNTSSSNSQSKAVALMRPASWNEINKFDQGIKNKRSAGYNDWKSQEAERLLHSARQQLPELMTTFKNITISSPLTFRDELAYPQGSVYGVRHGNDQFQVQSRTKLPGLLLSGQNILMPGIMGASLSALISVGNIVGLKPLWQEVVKCN